MKPNKSLLTGALELWDIGLEDAQIDSLMRYAEMVDEYQEANITGAKSIEEVVRDHLTDSLSCLIIPEIRKATNSVDVGSGGGFPGLPLAIATRPASWTMIDATQKKVKFLKYAANALGSAEVAVQPGRVEDIGQDDEFRGKYDVSTARAVASLDVLIEYCIPMVRVGGVLVAMKAKLDGHELGRGERAAGIIGAEISEVKAVPTLPGIEPRERNLVVVRKVDVTPEKYPRSVGTPGKIPLGT